MAAFTLPKQAHYIYIQGKSRAKRLGIPFTITSDFVLEALEQGYCQASGEKFVWEEEAIGRTGAARPSLDQIVPGKGYTPENVQVVTWRYNQLKNAYSNTETLAWIKKIAEHVANRYDTVEAPKAAAAAEHEAFVGDLIAEHCA